MLSHFALYTLMFLKLILTACNKHSLSFTKLKVIAYWRHVQASGLASK